MALGGGEGGDVMPEEPDRLIVAGVMAGDPVAARRRLRAAALEQEFYDRGDRRGSREALKRDPEMLIELAEAASAVAAGRQPPMPHTIKMRRADERAAARAAALAD